jgi:hypothetical protein
VPFIATSRHTRPGCRNVRCFLDNDALTLAAEGRALATAREALHLVQTNYWAGTANNLDVLSAIAQYHQAEIAEKQQRDKFSWPIPFRRPAY